MMTRPRTVEGVKADRGIPIPQGIPIPPARPQNPVVFEGEFDVGVTAFCRGAGSEPSAITTEARGAALQLAGQLLREAVLGLMDLNQSRNEFRNRFRISPPANDGPESPLNFSRGVDEALVRLLPTLSTPAGSVEPLRQNFPELNAQSTPSLPPTPPPFDEFLFPLPPQQLQP